MALAGPVMAMGVVPEESALVLAHHQCTTAQGHLHRRFRCKFRSLLQTDGTILCCRHRNRRSLPRICSNLLWQAAMARVTVTVALEESARPRCRMALGQ